MRTNEINQFIPFLGMPTQLNCICSSIGIEMSFYITDKNFTYFITLILG